MSEQKASANAIICITLEFAVNTTWEGGIAVSEKDTIMLNTCELPGSKHSPYKPGLHQNEELASDYVQTHQEIDCTMTQIPLHSHPFFELSYVRRCQNTDYSIGAKKYRLNVGDILLIPPDTLHGAVLSNEKQSQLVRDVLWLSPHFLNRMRLMTSGTQNYRTEESIVFRTNGTKWEYLEKYFQTGIVECEQKLYGWESIIESNTIQLWTNLVRALLESSVPILKDKKTDLVLLITDYIENNLSEKITLELVAEVFEISKSTVTQSFRKKLGVSFYAYVTHRRLLKAKSLISRGGKLETAGKQVGFTDYSAFYRAFIKEFGISPKEYRDSCTE